MSVYVINLTDPSKPTFYIVPTDVDGPSGVNRNTDLNLVGKSSLLWGEKVNENFAHLLENFACPNDSHAIVGGTQSGGAGANYFIVDGDKTPSFGTSTTFEVINSTANDGTYTVTTSEYLPSPTDQTHITVDEVIPSSTFDGEAGDTSIPDKSLEFSPTTPLQGQVWFNSSSLSLMVYSGTDWSTLSAVVSTTAPTSPSVGQLWFDSGTDQLFVWNGLAWDATILASGVSAMTGDLDMGTNKIINVVDPTDPQDAATMQYVENHATDTDLHLSAHQNTLLDDVESMYATLTAMDLGALDNFDYTTADDTGSVQDQLDKKVSVNGDTMLANLDMGTHSLLNVDDPVTGADAMSRNYADARYIQFASGTKMVFFQASAPTGWTLDATHNNKALRVVNAAGGGSGGTHDLDSPPSTSHVHTGPSHQHTYDVLAHKHETAVLQSGTNYYAPTTPNPFGVGGAAAWLYYMNSTLSAGGSNYALTNDPYGSPAGGNTGSSGTGNTGSASPTQFAPKYIDVIVCTKD